MDALEKVLRPIVEGQLRSLVNDHPKIVEAVDWYKRRDDKAQTFINSATKRILSDLLCSETRMRLIAALGVMGRAETVDAELVTPSELGGSDLAALLGQDVVGVEITTAPATSAS